MNTITIIEILKKRNETVVTAESCTGGAVSHLLTSIPGASAVVLGGIVAYDPRVKVQLLHVDSLLVTPQTIVSAATAQAMALGARRLLSSTWALATTGFAGPSGGNDTYNVGDVCVAIAGPNNFCTSTTLHFPNQLREDVMNLAAKELLKIFYEILLYN